VCNERGPVQSEIRKQAYERSFDMMSDSKNVHIDWKVSTDWDGTRILDWTIKAMGDDVEGITKKYAYLITKDELVKLMRDVGFSRVHVLAPDDTRDNLIVGLK
jgi:hypothetical protein